MGHCHISWGVQWQTSHTRVVHRANLVLLLWGQGELPKVGSLVCGQGVGVEPTFFTAAHQDGSIVHHMLALWHILLRIWREKGIICDAGVERPDVNPRIIRHRCVRGSVVGDVPLPAIGLDSATTRIAPRWN